MALIHITLLQYYYGLTNYTPLCMILANVLYAVFKKFSLLFIQLIVVFITVSVAFITIQQLDPFLIFVLQLKNHKS